ncbi:MAG: murein biosynthesis integral membrane protein MurJ [Bacteriovoracales bacterium]
MSDSNYKVLSSSIKMGSATFASRIMGLVREQVQAAIFGASGLTDAFLVAFRVPNVLRDLFAEGSFSPAFVPVFLEERIKDPMLARRLLWSLATLLTIITTILSLLMIIFAPDLIRIFAPTFIADPEKFQLTVALTRIMAPFLILVSLAALFMGALNSLKIFFMPALAPVFFNLLMILSALIFPPFFVKWGFHPIFSLGVGVILGGIFQMACQIPLILSKGYGPIGPIQLINKTTKRILHRVSIGTIGTAATQINVLITTILATGTVVGAVSWLSYAFRLFQFPVGVFSVSIAGSNLVHFSDSWKEGNKEKAIEFLSTSYLLSILILVPATFLLTALSVQTVHLIFERGLFNSHDTNMTTLALNYYMVGLPFYGLYKIFSPIFYTLDKPKIPVIISIISIVANIIFCLILVPYFGFKILALGTSLSMLLNSALLGFLLKKDLEISYGFFFNLRIGKIFFASIVSYFFVDFITNRIFDFKDIFVYKILVFCFLGLIGIIFYAILLILLGEFRQIKELLR